MSDDTLMDILIRHEGKRAKAYKDTKGLLTIGIGHNLSMPISEAAIQQIYRDDVNEAYNECLHTFPWFAELTERRQWAMIDARFNLGLTRLLGFQKFLKHMSLGEYDQAGSELLDSDAARELPERYAELANMIRGTVDT